MATINVSLKTTKDHTEFKKSGVRGQNIQNVMNLLKAAMGGSDAGAEVYVSTSSTSPVAASGTLTLTYGNITADDTVVIAGQTLTCKGSGTVANTWVKVTDATATATNLKNCINANATLAKYMIATSAAGVVTITAHQKASWGNLITIVGSTGVVASAATLASGAGGPEGASVQVR